MTPSEYFKYSLQSKFVWNLTPLLSILIWLKGKINLNFSKETLKSHKCLVTIKVTWRMALSPHSVLMQKQPFGGQFQLTFQLISSTLCKVNIKLHHFASVIIITLSFERGRIKYSSYYIFPTIYYFLVHHFIHTCTNVCTVCTQIYTSWSFEQNE